MAEKAEKMRRLEEEEEREVAREQQQVEQQRQQLRDQRQQLEQDVHTWSSLRNLTYRYSNHGL